jgi:hypothetical protein
MLSTAPLNESNSESIGPAGLDDHQYLWVPSTRFDVVYGRGTAPADAVYRLTCATRQIAKKEAPPRARGGAWIYEFITPIAPVKNDKC